MPTVLLRGGLGNQMFQYAAGLRLARASGTPLYLDATYLDDRFPRRNFTPREYCLDIFTLQPSFTRLSRISTSFPIPGLWLGLDLLSRRNAIREMSSTTFETGLLSAPGNSFLIGHWQSELYFKDAADAVRQDFKFRHPLMGAAADISNQIRATRSVSLHVRRGDYVVTKIMEDRMGKTNADYYNRAVNHIAQRVETPTFFIFSDDIEWCKENIKPGFPTIYVDRSSQGPKASSHLHLMSLCQHNIIANSTYSWWGAWLNNNPSKIVIAPDAWYADKPGASELIIPATWERL